MLFNYHLSGVLQTQVYYDAEETIRGRYSENKHCLMFFRGSHETISLS